MQKLEDWLVKNIKNVEAYLESSQKPTTKLLGEHRQRQKVGNYLHKIAPPQAFNWALNSPPERAENQHHAETIQSIRNASKLTGFNKTWDIPEYHEYLQFHNVN